VNRHSGWCPEARSDLFIGLMSGTSLDGIDCVLSDFSERPTLVARCFVPYPAELKAALIELCRGGHDELERAARMGADLSARYAQAVNELLLEAGVEPGRIAAIGCHGQTVRHRPEQGFTIQLVNPALLAERTAITVVADFRSRDLAAGGQGAPLVPAFHAACFRSSSRHRVVVNIGGIANLTDLPIPDDGAVRGFDSGPGNILLDAWAGRRLGTPCDRDGALAASGSVISELLALMLADEYFARVPPKSTGRERFNTDWLAAVGVDRYPVADVQATLAELTVRTIAEGIERWCSGAEEVFASGGGVHNADLMRRLRARLDVRTLATTDTLGVPADWVEAMAFAWLARQTLSNAPGNLPEVTGAAGSRMLGAIYPA